MINSEKINNMNAFNSPNLIGPNGGEKSKKQSELVRFALNSPYSKNSLDRNALSFHRVLSNSLRKAVVLVIDKVLTKNLGEEVIMTLKFKALGIPSDRLIKPRGKVKDNFNTDPSMKFEVVVFTPNID